MLNQPILTVSEEKLKSVCKWQTHNEKTYIFLNLRKLNDFEIIGALYTMTEWVKDREDNSVRVLTDLTGIKAGFNTHMTIRQLSKSNQKYIGKSAIVGISRGLYPFYKLYRSFTQSQAKVFEDIEEARAYVCS